MKAYFNLDGDFIIEGENTAENVAMTRIMLGNPRCYTVQVCSEEYNQNSKLLIHFEKPQISEGIVVTTTQGESGSRVKLTPKSEQPN